MEPRSQASQENLIPDPKGTVIFNILGVTDPSEKSQE